MTSATRGSSVRVAHVVARLPVGGMETVVANLAREMADGHVSSEIWCLEALDQLGAELRDQGLPVHLFGRRSRRDWSLFFRIAQALRARQIDIVHCHDEVAWFYGCLAARLVPGVRVVVTFHGRRPDIGTRHLREQRLLARLTHAIVPVSEPLRTALIDELRLAPDRVSVILNGIAVGNDETAETRARARTLLGVSGDAFVVGTVGEMSPVKNLELAIEGVAAARARIPAVTLVFIGDGSERSRLEAAVERCGLTGRVLMAGIRRDVPQLLPAFDVYVCSSRYEGTSLSILEAMSHGLAVVATDVGGNRHVLGDGACGTLVPPDDRQAFASALIGLFERPEERERLGSAAAAWVRRRYSLAAMTTAYREVYAAVLGGSPTPQEANTSQVTSP